MRKGENLKLTMHIRKVEQFLPRPHIVSGGENHYQIAMDYLLNVKGIEKKQALILLERTLLFEPLQPGFKIWNFLSNGEFGSFISQGSALVSPNEINRIEKRKISDSRDFAIRERDILANNVKVLKDRRILILKQINHLNEERNHLMKKIESLNRDNVSMIRTINSIHYIANTKSNLIKQKILKGGFLRSLKLCAISTDLYSKSIDLRSDHKILLNYSEFNIKTIKKILIFPKFFKKHVDYEVKIMKDSRYVEIEILKPIKFKNEKIVISVN